MASLLQHWWDVAVKYSPPLHLIPQMPSATPASQEEVALLLAKAKPSTRNPSLSADCSSSLKNPLLDQPSPCASMQQFPSSPFVANLTGKAGVSTPPLSTLSGLAFILVIQSPLLPPNRGITSSVPHWMVFISIPMHLLAFSVALTSSSLEVFGTLFSPSSPILIIYNHSVSTASQLFARYLFHLTVSTLKAGTVFFAFLCVSHWLACGWHVAGA